MTTADHVARRAGLDLSTLKNLLASYLVEGLSWEQKQEAVALIEELIDRKLAAAMRRAMVEAAARAVDFDEPAPTSPAMGA